MSSTITDLLPIDLRPLQLMLLFSQNKMERIFSHSESAEHSNMVVYQNYPVFCMHAHIHTYKYKMRPTFFIGEINDNTS